MITPAPSSRAQRDRLRDYYGIASSSTSASSSTPLTRQPSDDPAQRYRELVKTQNISGLLRAQSDLLTEIRELDGDRQSLVYNHHTDLVSASETISKMKTHAEALSPTLSALQTSFDNMSRLESQLRSALLPIMDSSSGSGEDRSGVLLQKDLIPIVMLPRQLRDIIALRDDGDEAAGLAQAEAQWGRHEAILSAWIADGVPGADGVASECRAILREQRERVRRSRGNHAVNGGGGGAGSAREMSNLPR